MAELLQGRDWSDPDSLGSYLQPLLSAEYIIVTDVTLYGCTPDAVVVGPHGLIVLQTAALQETEDSDPEVGPSSWQRFVPGPKPERRHPGQEAQRATKAVRRLLRTEFPGLRANVCHCLVFDGPHEELVASDAGEPLAVGRDAVAETITRTEMMPGGDLLDQDTRQDIAQALRDAPITTPSRATAPFVFRSGGLFGSGKKVWTIQAAIEHMDRYPEDGYFHLRNGSIARWFSAQGAEPLADLAQEVLRVPETDSRVVLERFLVESGLVRRAQLSVRPGRINLGYVLSGESATAIIQVRKGRGRGYPFGDLHTDGPWLRVDPRTFSGPSTEATVSVDTTELLVARKPWQAELLVESEAAEEPVVVPVRVSVAGMPSALDRSLLRPLVGMTYAGVLGMALGWLLGHLAIPEPGWFSGSILSPIGWTALWVLALGLFWALLGGLRGARQPLAWPTGYALSRWFLRTLVWAGVFTLLAVAGYWALGHLAAGQGSARLPFTTISLTLIAWSLAIVPAVLGDLRSAPDSEDARALASWRFLLRPALVGVVGVVLALSLVVGVQALGPSWQAAGVDDVVSTARDWLGEQFTGVETGLNGVIDEYYLRYYDRRAPAQPTLVPTPTSSSGAGRELP
jgi:hypothetical protein